MLLSVPRFGGLVALCLLLAGCMSEEQAVPTQPIATQPPQATVTQPQAARTSSETRYYAVVIIRDSNGEGHQITGPPHGTEAAAVREVAAIRRAMATGDQTRIPWLAVEGGDVKAAYLFVWPARE
jgi:hypothetical protein